MVLEGTPSLLEGTGLGQEEEGRVSEDTEGMEVDKVGTAGTEERTVAAAG